MSFTRGKLYHLLSNVVYIGKARHKDRIYDGEHEPIIDEKNVRCSASSPEGPGPKPQEWLKRRQPAFAHRPAVRRDRRSAEPGVHRQGRQALPLGYISNRLETTTRNDPSGWRLPADELERTVLHQLDAMLRDNVKLSEWTGMLVPAIPVHTAIARAGAFRAALQTSSPSKLSH